MKKKSISLILVLCMIVFCVTSVGFSASAQSVDTAAQGASADYGLPQDCKDGNILQCFNWTLAQIKEELPNIAAAGFTSVQTSPLQTHTGKNQWYWLYQPNGFTIGNELGSYNDLKSLCTEADKYGVKIIVDVVANHLAGSNSGTLASSVESSMRKTEYYHNLGACNDWNNRYDVTHKNIGMPDLNSENTDVQDIVANMIAQLQDAGVDGIRWDAAKHISLPSEDCDFWSRMAEFDMYQYGEILGSPAGSSGDAVNKALMIEYAQYINVTDESYCNSIRDAVTSGSTLRTNGYLLRRGVTGDKIVLWGESHDTYSNTDGATKNTDQNMIDKVYAIFGARADSQALYLSRPSSNNYSSIYYGRKGSTHFTSKEVAAVNHFHNAMIGTAEKYNATAGCYIVWREGGAVIVSMKGSDVDVSVPNTDKMVPEGVYTDEVSGNSFTVTEKTISGHIGSTGIAVVYNADTPSEQMLLGDVDNNGAVESVDATYIQRYYALMNTSDIDEAVMLRNGDVDNNGDLEIIDATYIQRWLALMPLDWKIGEYVPIE